jgi:hypothetical protein
MPEQISSLVLFVGRGAATLGFLSWFASPFVQMGRNPYAKTGEEDEELSSWLLFAGIAGTVCGLFLIWLVHHV